MVIYYVNNTLDHQGNHEVHREDCDYLKIAISTTYLGKFNSCYEAVRKAKEIYPTADGCYYCSRDCHTE